MILDLHPTTAGLWILAQVYPTVPDNTVSIVQLWMIAFGILTTVIASLMRFLPNDLPDLTKKGIVAVLSIALAAIGLAVQNDLIPQTLIRAALTILIVASGIYALLGRNIQDGLAGVKTITVSKTDPAVVVDPGH